jgi:hypothetical protein
MAPIIIRQSLGKAVWLAVVAAIFVAIGVRTWLTGRPEDRLIAACVTIFFGLGLLVFLARIAAPGRLVIDAHGITQTSLLRTTVIPWSAAANFRVWRMHRTDFIAFDDLRPPGTRRALRAMNRLVGAEAALAPGWAMQPERLAALLNATRASCTGQM